MLLRGLEAFIRRNMAKNKYVRQNFNVCFLQREKRIETIVKSG
jgi:hypothetical protein